MTVAVTDSVNASIAEFLSSSQKGSIDDDTVSLASESPDAKNDIYGQVHLIESPSLIATSLADLNNELENIPQNQKKEWTRAQEEIPQLVGNAHKLMFLRCEVFNTSRAATRIVKYWEKRVELFKERAYRPLTIENMFDEDDEAITLEHLQLLPDKDFDGRAVLLFDLSKIDTYKYARDSYRKWSFYTTWSALQDEEVQRKGIITIIFPHGCQYHKFDRKLAKQTVEATRGCLPMRVGAFHVCHAPTTLKLVLPFFKVLLGSRLRKRIKFHFGTDEHVVSKLGNYGIQVENIPTELGGTLVLNQNKWVAKRRESGL